MSNSGALGTRMRRVLAWCCVALIVLPVVALLPYAFKGTELVRLRNAVLLQGVLEPGFDWSAPPPLAGFSVDHAPFDPYFVEVARQLQLDELPDDWERAVAISRHLLGSHPNLLGHAARADLASTHAAITQRGEGYCADFIRVFMAIASSAGMQQRALAFSFDGFGGWGHIWIEIWNRQVQRWQLVGLFNNYRFDVDGQGPLSAIELREVLQTRPENLVLSPLEPRARPGWVERSKALDYFVRGLDEWYAIWGTNVMAVEQSLAYRALAPLSYSLARIGAVIQGVSPGVRVVRTVTNGDRIGALQRLRFQVWISGLSVLGGAVLAAGILLTRTTWARQRDSKAQ